MLDLIESAKNKLGKSDIQSCCGKNLIAEFEQYIDAAKRFDEEFKASLKPLLNMMVKTVKKLEASIKLDWNSMLDLKDGDYIYYKPTPEKEKLQIKCPDCVNTFTNAQSYQRHVKKEHKKDIQVPKPRVTCRLEHRFSRSASIEIDQIGVHLQRVHKIKKPSPDHFFDGFESFDSGATIQVKYKVKGGPAAKSSVSKSTTRVAATNDDVETPDTNDALENTAENHTSAKNNEDVVVRPNSNNDDPLNCGSSNIVAENENELAYHQPISLVLSGTEANTGSNVENDGGNSDEPSSRVEPEPEKNVNDGGKSQDQSSRVEPETEKNPIASAGFDAIDEFCIDEDYVNSVEIGVAINESVNIEGDSDEEEGDTYEYTYKRIQNMSLRYQTRCNPEQTEFCSLEGNKQFIEDVLQYVKDTASAFSEEPSSVRFTKALLFSHDDSFLQWMRKKDPSFRLSDLICFKDEFKLKELTDPAQWINLIGGEDGKQKPARRKEMYKV